MKIDRKKRAFYRNINILQRALLVVILGLIIQILVSEIFILLIEDIGIRRPLDDAGGLELDERFVALGQQDLPVVCWVDTDDLAEAAVEMVVVVLKIRHRWYVLKLVTSDSCFSDRSSAMCSSM